MEKKKLKSRKEKIEFLQGLKNKTRSISEIIDPQVIILRSRNTEPGIVYNETTGEILTTEEARLLQERVSKDTLIWVEVLTYAKGSTE